MPWFGKKSKVISHVSIDNSSSFSSAKHWLKNYPHVLTLICTRGDNFYLFLIFDQILSAEFFIKTFQTFWRWKLTSIGLLWHPAQLIEFFKGCPLVAKKMRILFFFRRSCQLGLKPFPISKAIYKKIIRNHISRYFKFRKIWKYYRTGLSVYT